MHVTDLYYLPTKDLYASGCPLLVMEAVNNLLVKHVTIYTDGACSGNPGPGGWSALLRYNGHIRELSGAEPRTTNNRMELTAAIEALQALGEPCNVSIFTDSAYLQRAFSDGWIEKWKKNGWMTASRKPVENRDLWERLIALTSIHRVHWNKVKGHAGDEWNDRADRLAVEAMRKLTSE